MSQMERNERAEYACDALVDVLWQPYESYRSLTRQQVEAAEAAWQEAVGEVRKWKDEHQKQAETFYQAVVRKSGELFFPDNSPLKKVAEQMEALVRQPIEFSLNLLERSEQVMAEHQAGLAKKQREQLDAWWSLQDHFTTAVQNQQRAFLRQMEDKRVSVVWA